MLKNYRLWLGSRIFWVEHFVVALLMEGSLPTTPSPLFISECSGFKPYAIRKIKFFIAGAFCVSGIVNSILVKSQGIAFRVGIAVGFVLLSGVSLFVVASIRATKSLLGLVFRENVFHAVSEHIHVRNAL